MHLIYLAVGIEWIDGMVFVSNASVAARFELAFQTNTVSCIIGIIPTDERISNNSILIELNLVQLETN